MGRLIDADRLKAHYCWWAGGTKEMTIDEAKKTFDTIIDVQPTVDAVPLEDYKSMEQTVNKLTKALADAEPVTRCKDCKHREVQVDGVFRYEMCGIRNEIINLDGFCHMGKRREDEIGRD